MSAAAATTEPNGFVPHRLAVEYDSARPSKNRRVGVCRQRLGRRRSRFTLLPDSRSEKHHDARKGNLLFLTMY